MNYKYLLCDPVGVITRRLKTTVLKDSGSTLLHTVCESSLLRKAGVMEWDQVIELRNFP